MFADTRKMSRCEFYYVFVNSDLAVRRGEEKCVTQCVLVFQAILLRASQICLREQGNGEQHVTDPCATVDSMLRLLRTLAFCFCCVLLLHNQAVADEEGLWGPTPPRENQGSYWWVPKLPPLPSLPFRNPFSGSSDSNDQAEELTTTATGATEPIDHLQEDSGSGEGSISETSEPPTTSTQGLSSSVTEIGRASFPAGTSDSPRSSVAQTHNDTLVSDSYSPTSSSIRNTLFTNSPTSTGTLEQNATHTRPPGSTVQAAGRSMGATTQHLQDERADKEKAGDFTEKIISTIALETTVPTALTWAVAQSTTTMPGLVETTLSVTAPMHSETMSVGKQQYSTVGVTVHAGETTVTVSHPTTSPSGSALVSAEPRMVPTEEQPGLITTATGSDHTPVLESITSTTQGQGVNFPIAGGKQS